MTDFYDALETREPAEREAALMAALPRVLARAQAGSEAMAACLAGVDPATVRSRAALAALPQLRKAATDCPEGYAERTVQFPTALPAPLTALQMPL